MIANCLELRKITSKKIVKRMLKVKLEVHV
jgi:hypothetical protein